MMIKVENVKVFNLEGAIRGMQSKGYRCKRSSYEAFVSNNGKKYFFGTYKTEEEAKEAVYKIRLKLFSDNVSRYEKNIYEGKVYKGKYVVYPSGNIFNLQGKMMIGIIGKDGYRHGIIFRKNENYHRIIALLFIPNPENKRCINHKDGNKLNNNVTNLEWCTHSENTIHAYKNNLEKPRSGEKHHNHKLTEDNVRFIRKMHRARDKVYGATALAKLFGVDRTTISSVVKREIWREVI